MKNEQSGFQLDKSDDRLKITLPVKIQWLLLAIYSVALVAWMAMIIVVISYLLGGHSSKVVLTILLIFWLLVWLILGKFLWTRWQFEAASREVIFIDEDQLILRRPVSIFGLTTTYDMNHVSPFYFSERHNCPAFDYAYMHVYFGRSMTPNDAGLLVSQLNSQYFPKGDDQELSTNF